MAGVNPIPAPSDNTIGQRLNRGGGLVIRYRFIRVDHHSDSGSQYLSLTYTDRLAALGPHTVSRLAQSARATLVLTTPHPSYQRRPQDRADQPRYTERCIDSVEPATAEWVTWYTGEHLHETLGSVPLVKYAAAHTSHKPAMPTLAANKEPTPGYLTTLIGSPPPPRGDSVVIGVNGLARAAEGSSDRSLSCLSE